MVNILQNMSSLFWVLLWIATFQRSYFSISFCFSGTIFVKVSYNIICFTWRLKFFFFNRKQCLYFSCLLYNYQSKIITCKVVNFLRKSFDFFSFYSQYGISTIMIRFFLQISWVVLYIRCYYGIMYRIFSVSSQNLYITLFISFMG